jgi:hypothetical protein
VGSSTHPRAPSNGRLRAKHIGEHEPGDARLASLLVLLAAQASCSKTRGLVIRPGDGGMVDVHEPSSERPANPPDVSPPDAPVGADEVNTRSDVRPLETDDWPATDAADAIAGDGQADGCLPVTCSPAEGDYCGIIGDGCGGDLDCGQCRIGWSCLDDHICHYAMDCWPGSYGFESCQPAGLDVELCGRVWSSCSERIMECPATCTKPGWVCDRGRCKGLPAVCTKLECRPAGGGQYCGPIGDACGGRLDCGECADGSVCGAVTRGVCGANEQGLKAPPEPIDSDGEGLAPPPPPPARIPE